MNKSELIEVLSREGGVSKVTAGKVLEVFMATVSKTLKEGDRVTLMGLGRFQVRRRAERHGRNPRTGGVIKIKAVNVPKFTPGKTLREAVNK